MIPETFHFIFGLKPQTAPFHIAHYLCLESCRRVYPSARITLYYRHEPHGAWWERIKPAIGLEAVEPEAFVVDNPKYRDSAEGLYILRNGLTYAHQTDFLRVKLLIERGGVYADMDTLFVQPMPSAWFRSSFLMGAESSGGGLDAMAEPFQLCNALLLGEPQAPFARRWLERMYQTFDGTWNAHCCVAPTQLARETPGDLTVVPPRAFYKHSFTKAGIAGLFEGCDRDIAGMYSMHLWAHLWWDEWRTDFSHFHADLLTEEYIRREDTTYNLLARRYLD